MLTLALARTQEWLAQTHTRQTASWSYAAPAPRKQMRAAMGTAPAPAPQAKVEVSRPEDPCEREAEETADQVVSTPTPTPAEEPGQATPHSALPRPRQAMGMLASSARRMLQRMAEAAQEHEVEEAPDTIVRTSREPGGASPDDDASEGLAGRISGLQQGGSPLPQSVRRNMEPHFGQDFSKVRVHTGAEPAQVSTALHATAFTVGEHISFSAGSFRPETKQGQHLIAHELAHVAQQRTHSSPETSAGAGAQVPGSGPIKTQASAPVQREANEPGLLDRAASLAGSLLAEPAYAALRRYAPDLEPIVRKGPSEWLKSKLASGFDGLVTRVTASLPPGAVEELTTVFGPLVERAGKIATALGSGDCKPLLQGIEDLKSFVAEVAGQAWDKLVGLLRPVGEFFTDLWNSAGAPAVDWLRQFAGSLWNEIKDLGLKIWQWTEPIRKDLGSVWAWIKEKLFGTKDDATGESSGGLVAWITAKAAEVWEWVKQQARPLWQPVAEAVQTIRSLVPPAFIRRLGDLFKDLGARISQAGAAMGAEGDDVAQNREALAAALPTLQQVLTMARDGLVAARTWLSGTITTLVGKLTGFLTTLRGTGILSDLADGLAWLERTGNGLAAWAQERVGGLFDWLLRGFDFVSPFVEKLVGVVRQLMSVAADLVQLPLLVAGSLWKLIPECIRNPIKDFLSNQILRRIPVFSSLLSVGEIWPKLEATAMRILRQVFVDGNLPRAAWTFFSAMLGLLGIPPELVVAILAKAASAIGDILTDPVGFLINLVLAAKQGFGLFFSSFGSHLLQGFTGWLFGSLKRAGITPPHDLSLRSILGLVVEVLGISVDHVFERLSKKVGPEVVASLRKALDVATGVWRWVRILIDEGPAGLWVELKEQMSGLWNMVMETAIGWLTKSIVIAAGKWLAGFAVPAIGPAINALVAIYRAIQAAAEYMRELLEMLNRLLDGVGGIARGALDVAAGFLEQALAAGLPVAIGFVAYQVGLGNISTRIKEVVEDIRVKVDQAIDWLIDRAIAGGRAVMDLARRGVAAVKEWWNARKTFKTASGEEHTLFFQGSGASAELMIASDKQTYREFIDSVKVKPEQEKDKKEAIGLADQLDQKLKKAASTSGNPAKAGGSKVGGPAQGASTTPDIGKLTTEIDVLLDKLAKVTSGFMSQGPGVSTTPISGAEVNEFGSSASVLRLASGHKEGSEPPSSLTNKHWERLKLRSEGAFYVRGHLLNAHLGGTGKEWKNLTPISQQANSLMKTRFENPVKRIVNGDEGPYKEPPPGKIPAGLSAVAFIVTANYGRPSRKADADARRAQGGLDKVVGDIVEAEENVPTSIDCSAHELSDKGKKFTCRIENEIEAPLDSYLPGLPKVVLYLNELKKVEDLQPLGLDAKLAQTVFDNRACRHYEDLKSKVTDAQWQTIQSKPNVRLRLYRLKDA